MLSRRNIRIKVMQVLYAMSRDRQMKFSDALQDYKLGIRKSYELYLFNLLQFMKVMEYAKQDASIKHAKLLPTEEDKAFKPKLFDNPLSQSLFENEGLQRTFRAYKTEELIAEDNIRSLYSEFAKSDAYKGYSKQKDSKVADHKEILIELYKFLASNELYMETMEDNFLSWTDDKSLVVGAMKKTLKALPTEEEFYKDYLPTDETTKDFGEKLLKKVNDSDAELLGIIEPTLKNWDADRVAVIDMILLKMALCELISFSTIPTKVTLNEFVEISKQYSTDKSKDFINGILDRLMKKLNKDGKINKEGRGLIN